MNNKNFFLALALATLGTTHAQGQADFFWSTANLGQGATNQVMADGGTLRVGDTGSLYLYWSSNGPLNSDLSVGAFLDVSTSLQSVIRFTDAETLDFDITNGGTDIGNRWLDDLGGGGSAGRTGTVTSDMIDEWHAFTVFGGSGILESNTLSPFADTGFDPLADAFLFGRIDFIAVGTGQTLVNASAGSGGIVNGGNALDPTIGSARITVAAVPEPSSILMIALSTIGIVVCNSRRPARDQRRATGSCHR